MGKIEKIEEMPFHRKYRPKTFKEFKGNDTLVKGIMGELAEGNQHSFLISGPTGTGKTTVARLIADSLGCDPSMFYEMDTANTRGIDTIRELIFDTAYDPLLGDIKVVLLDECHQITGAAAEALLKFLEDTPKHVYIILCTTNPENLKDTVKNRCSRWTVSPLGLTDMTNLIDEVLEKEKKTIPYKVKETIIKVSDGCPRQALVLLEQVVHLEGEVNQLQVIIDNTLDEVSVKDICSRIIKRAFWSDKEVAGIKQQGLGHFLEGLKQDPETTRRGVLGYFSKVLIGARDNKEAVRIAAIMDVFSDPVFNTGRAGFIKMCWKSLQIG